MSSSNRPDPNPDEIIIPDPGFNVIIYKGECYSRTNDKAPIDTIPGYPYTGWDKCIDCFQVNPTPTPTPTWTYPAPAEVGFPVNISSHTENDVVDVEVHRLAGFGIPFEVDYTVTSLSAIEEVDYLVEPSNPGTLEFEDTDNVKYIRLVLLHDYDLTELAELLHINLTEARPTQPRMKAEIKLGKELRIVQINESGIPPPVTIGPGDVYNLTETQFNLKFSGSPGEDATVNIYPDISLWPALFYPITIKNVGGFFEWDSTDAVNSQHIFTTFPEGYSFKVNNPTGIGIWYKITYAGPGSFKFHAELDIPGPTPTPTPTPSPTQTPGPTPTPTPTPTPSPTPSPTPTPTPTPTAVSPSKTTIYAVSDDRIYVLGTASPDENTVVTLESAKVAYTLDSGADLSPTFQSTATQPFTSIWADDRYWYWRGWGYKSALNVGPDLLPIPFGRHSWTYSASYTHGYENSSGWMFRRTTGAPQYDNFVNKTGNISIQAIAADEQPYIRGLSTGAIRRSTFGVINNEWNDQPTSGKHEDRLLKFKIDHLNPHRGVYVAGGSPTHRPVDSSALYTNSLNLPNILKTGTTGGEFWKHPNNSISYQVGEKLELFNPTGQSKEQNVIGYQDHGANNNINSHQQIEDYGLARDNIEFYNGRYVIAELTDDPASTPLSDGAVFGSWHINSTHPETGGSTLYYQDRTAGGPNRDNSLSGENIPLSAWMRIEMEPITTIDIGPTNEYDLILRSTIVEPVPTATPTPTPTPTPTVTLSNGPFSLTMSPQGADLNPDASVELAKATHGSPGWRSHPLSDHNYATQWTTRFYIGGVDKFGYNIHIDDEKTIHVAGTFDTHLVVNYDLEINETYSIMYNDLGIPSPTAFSPGTTPYTQAFVTRHNPQNGKITSCLTTRGQGRSVGHDVVTDSKGNMYLVGSVAGDVDFINDHGLNANTVMGVNTGSLSSSYGFIAKIGWGHEEQYDVNITQKPIDYTWQWVQYIDTRVEALSTENREIRAAVIDPQDRLFVAGYFDSPTEIGTTGAASYSDPTQPQFEPGYKWIDSTDRNFYVARMNIKKFGQVEWSKVFTTPGAVSSSVKLAQDDDKLYLSTYTTTVTSAAPHYTVGGACLRDINVETGAVDIEVRIYGEDLEVTDIEILDDERLAVSINYTKTLEFDGIILSAATGDNTKGAYMILDNNFNIEVCRLIHNPVISSNTDVTCDSISVNYAERELLIHGTSQESVQVTDPLGAIGILTTTQPNKYLTYIIAHDI